MAIIKNCRKGTKKNSYKGGAKRLSLRAKTVKKKLAKIKTAETVYNRKQKKLDVVKNKLEKAEAKVSDLLSKMNVLDEQVNKAYDDLEYSRNQLSFSELKETE
tara:strand:- start:695 stop:1003 length:309 start_codon:yes stop_codon:yes gene_type:complete